jgi:hypothetical protein
MVSILKRQYRYGRNSYTQKRPYCCVKRPETTDTENSSDSSESIPSLASAIVQRANINEKVARLLADIPKFECDYKDMEEGTIADASDGIDSEESLLFSVSVVSGLFTQQYGLFCV